MDKIIRSKSLCANAVFEFWSIYNYRLLSKFVTCSTNIHYFCGIFPLAGRKQPVERVDVRVGNEPSVCDGPASGV